MEWGSPKCSSPQTENHTVWVQSDMANEHNSFQADVYGVYNCKRPARDRPSLGGQANNHARLFTHETSGAENL